MNKRYVVELTEYMVWVNQIVRNWLSQLSQEQWEQTIPSSFTSVRQTVIHMVSAERIWLDFWQQVPNPVFLSQEFNGSTDELMAIWTSTTFTLTEFIEQYPQEAYTKPVTFTVRGELWQQEFWQTFAHFINHATYHRGQLVTLLRQVGFSAFNPTDLAMYNRQLPG